MFGRVFSQTTPEVDRFLGVLPVYHIFASVSVVYPRYHPYLTHMSNRAVKVCMFPLSRGLGAVILRGFDPVSFGNSIQQYKISFCPIVPPILVLIANNPVFEQFDFSNVRAFLSGRLLIRK